MAGSGSNAGNVGWRADMESPKMIWYIIATLVVAGGGLCGYLYVQPLPVKTKLGQLACGLTGHVDVQLFERGRWGLVCCNCGRETPGWEVGK